MMTPTEELKHEHNIILHVLKAAQKQVDQTGGPDPAIVSEMIDFFVNFVDRCHHTKEEKHLFPKMEEHGIRHEGGPIGVMLQEHGQGRSLVAAMREGLAANDTAAMKNHLLDYVHLLQSHIGKENEVLFVMADKVLSDTEQQDLSKAFAKVEAEEMGEGVHEKYHELAHRLATE